MGMRRNFITGEWEEFAEGFGGRWVHHHGKVVRIEDTEVVLKPRKSSNAICSKNPHVSKAMAIPIHQAAKFNEAARRNHTGATYVPDGKGYANCVTTSRGSRAKEMRARGRIDNDGGYGDNHVG
jgi:hypothetical protein